MGSDIRILEFLNDGLETTYNYIKGQEHLTGEIEFFILLTL